MSRFYLPQCYVNSLNIINQQRMLTARICRYAGTLRDELAADKMSMSVIGIKGAKLV